MSDAPPVSAESVPRHYAGVLISADPASFTEVRRRLDAMPGVAVHHLDPATGRCVAVLESADRAEGERLFRALGRLAHVHSVDLVYHLVDPEVADAADPSADSGRAFPETES